MEEVLRIFLAVSLLGACAQWFAWKLRFPVIILLLAAGFMAGPITGWVDRDFVNNEFLFAVVSLSVALILFEGSLQLKLKDLKQSGQSIGSLVSIGALITWVLISFFAKVVLNFSIEMSVLLGAILIVTGPTVVQPLLRLIRPTGKVNTILKWEGLTIDPIGALMAVLVYEVIIADGFSKAVMLVIGGIIKTVLFGIFIGFVCAAILIFMIYRYWVPEYLHNALTLMLMTLAFVASVLVENEPTGFLSVMVMGFVLANQNFISIKNIVAFKENLRTLILPGLFIVLAARIPLSDLVYINWKTGAFLLFLILIVRPVSVYVSMRRTALNNGEKLFLSAMAPRGVVAAAVTSIFAQRLTAGGYVEAEQLNIIVFFVIIGTVLVYGLVAPGLAYGLKLANAKRQGVLIFGAHAWARSLARVIKDQGVRVILVDKNAGFIQKALKEGLEAVEGDMLADNVVDQIDLNDMGKLFVLTSNDEANVLALMHFRDIFDQAELYSVRSSFNKEEMKGEEIGIFHGRSLFLPGMDYNFFDKIEDTGESFKSLKINNMEEYQQLKIQHGAKMVELMLIQEKRGIEVRTSKANLNIASGKTLIYIIAQGEWPWAQ